MRIFAIVLWFTSFYVAKAAQPADSLSAAKSFFGGQITATNNGVSLIPSFTLGRPAVLFDLSLGRKRLSFDPMIRFAMDGKPWSFIFWWRYKLIQQPRFSMGVGAHPAFVFREMSVPSAPTPYLVAQRFFAWEATPLYHFSKRFSAGLYYLGSKGLQATSVQNTHFVALKANMMNLPLSDKLRVSVVPQLYFLKMDTRQGYYTNATVILGRQGFPLTLSGIVSKAFKTTIPNSDFVWNVGVNYVINNQYRKVN